MYGQRVDTDLNIISWTLSTHACIISTSNVYITHSIAIQVQYIVKCSYKLENCVGYVIPWPRGHHVKSVYQVDSLINVWPVVIAIFLVPTILSNVRRIVHRYYHHNTNKFILTCEWDDTWLPLPLQNHSSLFFFVLTTRQMASLSPLANARSRRNEP